MELPIADCRLKKHSRSPQLEIGNWQLAMTQLADLQSGLVNLQ